jgi:hypothetical protein
MFLSRHQKAGLNNDIKVANRSFENVTQFKYLGTTVTNQNLIQEESKRLNWGDACYHSVQNLLFSRLLFKIVKIRIYKAVILPLVLYAFEPRRLTALWASTACYSDSFSFYLGISEEHINSVFRVEEKAKRKQATCFLLVFSLF